MSAHDERPQATGRTYTWTGIDRDGVGRQGRTGRTLRRWRRRSSTISGRAGAKCAPPRAGTRRRQEPGWLLRSTGIPTWALGAGGP